MLGLAASVANAREADVQLFADLAVVVALGHLLHHLQLAVG